MDSILSEELLSGVVDALVRLVEAAGALVIVLGAAVGFVCFLVVALRRRGTAAFVPVRLDIARFLDMGLEFQLASDIMRTAIAPTFQEIGQPAAVAAIRTALKYFLGREIQKSVPRSPGRTGTTRTSAPTGRWCEPSVG